MKYKDYYATLGVARGASAAEIKRAYRLLARKYHPDVSKAVDAEERFKELGEAYAVLKDEEKRAAYDSVGSEWTGGEEFAPPPGWDTGFEFSGRDFAAGMSQSDFFDALFGRPGSGQAGGPARGGDHHAKILIDVEDAYHGAQRNLTLRLPTRDTEGRATSREHRLEVSIPRGIRGGQHLRLSGQGDPGLGDGPAGDLYLEVGFNAHPRYRVDGRDVLMDLPLAPWEAALGCAPILLTPEGLIQLTVPPGTGARRQFRFKGKGIPASPAGDLYAVVDIVLPPAVTEKEQAAYRALADAFDFAPRAT